MHGYLIAIANTISQCFVEQKQAIIYIHKGPPLSLSQKNASIMKPFKHSQNHLVLPLYAIGYHKSTLTSPLYLNI